MVVFGVAEREVNQGLGNAASDHNYCLGPVLLGGRSPKVTATGLLTISRDHEAHGEANALTQHPAQSRKRSWTRHPTLAYTRCIEAHLQLSVCIADLSFGFVLPPASSYNTCSKDPVKPEWLPAFAAARNDAQSIAMVAVVAVFQDRRTQIVSARVQRRAFASLTLLNGRPRI